LSQPSARTLPATCTVKLKIELCAFVSIEDPGIKGFLEEEVIGKNHKEVYKWLCSLYETLWVSSCSF